MAKDYKNELIKRVAASVKQKESPGEEDNGMLPKATEFEMEDDTEEPYVGNLADHPEARMLNESMDPRDPSTWLKPEMEFANVPTEQLGQAQGPLSFGDQINIEEQLAQTQAQTQEQPPVSQMQQPQALGMDIRPQPLQDDLQAAERAMMASQGQLPEPTPQDVQRVAGYVDPVGQGKMVNVRMGDQVVGVDPQEVITRAMQDPDKYGNMTMQQLAQVIAQEQQAAAPQQNLIDPQSMSDEELQTKLQALQQELSKRQGR